MPTQADRKLFSIVVKNRQKIAATEAAIFSGSISGGVFFGKSSKSDQAMPLTAMMEEYGLKYAGSIDGEVLCL